jgi:hypothetical protein
MPRCPACAVRAAARSGVERRDGHVATTSRCVWGEDPCAEEQDRPGRVTYGDRPDKRPDRPQVVRSTRGVERAVPRWGTREDGQAAATTRQTTFGSKIAPRLARHGVAPGADLDGADAARVTAAQLAALEGPLCIPR